MNQSETPSISSIKVLLELHIEVPININTQKEGIPMGNLSLFVVQGKALELMTQPNTIYVQDESGHREIFNSMMGFVPNSSIKIIVSPTPLEEDSIRSIKLSKQKQACLSCRLSKVHCSGETPCKRCVSRNDHCTYAPPKKRGRKIKYSPTEEPTKPNQSNANIINNNYLDINLKPSLTSPRGCVLTSSDEFSSSSSETSFSNISPSQNVSDISLLRNSAYLPSINSSSASFVPPLSKPPITFTSSSQLSPMLQQNSSVPFSLPLNFPFDDTLGFFTETPAFDLKDLQDYEPLEDDEQERFSYSNPDSKHTLRTMNETAIFFREKMLPRLGPGFRLVLQNALHHINELERDYNLLNWPHLTTYTTLSLRNFVLDNCIDSNPDPIAVWSTTGVLLFFNLSMYKLVKWRAEDVYNKDERPNRGLLHIAHLEDLLQLMQNHIAVLNDVSKNQFRVSLRIYDQKGKEIQTNVSKKIRYFLFNFKTFFFSQGFC